MKKKTTHGGNISSEDDTIGLVSINPLAGGGIAAAAAAAAMKRNIGHVDIAASKDTDNEIKSRNQRPINPFAGGGIAAAAAAAAMKRKSGNNKNEDSKISQPSNPFAGGGIVAEDKKMIGIH